MSSTTISAAVYLLVGMSVLTGAGCASIGPNVGFLGYPIPVSPYHMKKPEDKAWEHERYGKVPVLPPIPPGGPSVAIDPPSDDEVMRALEEIDPVQGGIPFLHEVQRNNVLIVKEKMSDFIDPPRVYPLIGPAQLHHSRWKCTISYTRISRPGWPLPHTKTDEVQEVVYVDHDHFHMCGNVDPGLGPAMAAAGGAPATPK